MEKNYKDNLIKAAHAGGAVLKKYFGQALNPKAKTAPYDLQTEADLESEKAILAILRKEYPEFNINSEEDGETKNNSDYTFHIDPLDGTNNFTIGIPNFSVSIGLVYKREIIAGVVYQPILDQTYYAEKDKGTFLNDEKIKVNNVSGIKNTTIAACFAYNTDKDYKVRTLAAFTHTSVKRVAWNWSVANDCCLLASGKIEAMTVKKLEPYDWVAGKIIAKEAGAYIVDYQGNIEKDSMNDEFIAGNTEATARQVLEILKPLD